MVLPDFNHPISACFSPLLNAKKLWWIPDLPESEYTESDYQRLANINITDTQLLISIGLKYWENVFHIKDCNYKNKLYFPNIISLKVGDKIFNKTKKEEYKIEKVRTDINGVFTGHVYLESYGNLELSDVLEVPNNKRILFLAAFPTIEDKKTVKFGNNNEVIDLTKPSRPIMTYRITREEDAPHSGNQQFGNTFKHVRGQFAGKREDLSDTNYYYEVYVKESAILVQYNGWTETNAQSDKLYYIFREFMEQFRSVLIFYGLSNMEFNGKTDDRFINYWSPAMNSRNLTYYFRTISVNKYRIRKETSLNIQKDIETL